LNLAAREGLASCLLDDTKTGTESNPARALRGDEQLLHRCPGLDDCIFPAQVHWRADLQTSVVSALMADANANGMASFRLQAGASRSSWHCRSASMAGAISALYHWIDLPGWV